MRKTIILLTFVAVAGIGSYLVFAQDPMGGGMMGQGGVNRGYPQGATIQEQLNMMNDRINLMQQMMEQMLEQQRLMLPPKK